ncbi:hypothetical protein AOE01nite_10560 [Acetobacter oeni]|uniref:Uncharacterized protein n=1 Tax=Acetobacter oeni TaxID=304077 RepID=A0A511XIR6_9PROT|nr:hypothetical protein [Acetobacter oeni]GEN62832.1 hypothetical protein AOE01nite_10560 [Acetobacter oeni]
MKAKVFDFYEDKGLKYCFDFGEEYGGEFISDELGNIDAPLLSVFRTRVASMNIKNKKAKTDA